MTYATAPYVLGGKNGQANVDWQAACTGALLDSAPPLLKASCSRQGILSVTSALDFPRTEFPIPVLSLS